MIEHITNCKAINGDTITIGDWVYNEATGMEYVVDSIRRLHWMGKFGKTATTLQIVLRRHNGAHDLRNGEFAVYGDKSAYTAVVRDETGGKVPAEIIDEHICKGRTFSWNTNLLTKENHVIKAAGHRTDGAATAQPKAA